MNETSSPTKSLEYYLSLKYPIEIVEDEGCWVSSIPSLPGCNSVGDTAEEAIANVQDAKELWLRSQIESGGDVPEPPDESSFSGKFVLRIPKDLHRTLCVQAEAQGVSLNHYASNLLAARTQLSAIDNRFKALLALIVEGPGDAWQEHCSEHRHHNVPIDVGSSQYRVLHSYRMAGQPLYPGADRQHSSHIYEYGAFLGSLVGDLTMATRVQKPVAQCQFKARTVAAHRLWYTPSKEL